MTTLKELPEWFLERGDSLNILRRVDAVSHQSVALVLNDSLVLCFWRDDDDESASTMQHLAGFDTEADLIEYVETHEVKLDAVAFIYDNRLDDGGAYRDLHIETHVELQGPDGAEVATASDNAEYIIEQIQHMLAALLNEDRQTVYGLIHDRSIRFAKMLEKEILQRQPSPFKYHDPDILTPLEDEEPEDDDGLVEMAIEFEDLKIKSHGLSAVLTSFLTDVARTGELGTDLGEQIEEQVDDLRDSMRLLRNTEVFGDDIEEDGLTEHGEYVLTVLDDYVDEAMSAMTSLEKALDEAPPAEVTNEFNDEFLKRWLELRSFLDKNWTKRSDM